MKLPEHANYEHERMGKSGFKIHTKIKSCRFKWDFRCNVQRRIQNPVRHIRWNILRK